MKISSIEAIPVRLPRPREQAVGTAGSPTPLARGSGDFRWSEAVQALYSIHFETALVKVSTDTGEIGWGEAQAPLAPEIVCEIVRLLLAPVLAGSEFDGSVETIRCLWQRMYQTMRVRGQTGGFMLDAISGVDIALWDLAGKIQGRSIQEMMGDATAESVPAYFSGVAGASIEEVIANAQRAAANGFRTFKLFHDSTAESMLARIEALAAALPDCRFAVDALWRLDPATAGAFGRELDRRNVLWLEAPLPPEEVEAHRKLARDMRTPIAVGESYRSHYEMMPFLAGGAAIVQPDLGRCGLTEFLSIAARARSAGVRVIPHVSIALGPQIAAAIHAAAAAGCELLEFNPNVLQVANQYLARPIEVLRAAYRVPCGHGLGIDLVPPSVI